MCDKLFNTTHSHDPDGHYIVPLPFANECVPSTFGTSKPTTEQRFHSLERKLHRSNNAGLHTLYIDFMSEYHSLGHLENCSSLAQDEPTLLSSTSRGTEGPKQYYQTSCCV